MNIKNGDYTPNTKSINEIYNPLNGKYYDPNNNQVNNINGLYQTTNDLYKYNSINNQFIPRE